MGTRWSMPFFIMQKNAVHKRGLCVRTFHPLQVVLCFFLCLMALSRLVWMQLHPYEAQLTSPVYALMQQTQELQPCTSLEEILRLNATELKVPNYEGPLSFFYQGFLTAKCAWGAPFSLQNLMRLNLWLIVGMSLLVLLWMRVLLGSWLQSSVIAVALLFRNSLVSRIYLVSLQSWASFLLLVGLCLLAVFFRMRLRWSWAVFLLLLLLWGGYRGVQWQDIDVTYLGERAFWSRWISPMVECLDLQYICSAVCVMGAGKWPPTSGALQKSLHQFGGICLCLFGYSLLASLQTGTSLGTSWNMVVVVEPLIIVYGIAILFQWVQSRVGNSLFSGKVSG